MSGCSTDVDLEMWSEGVGVCVDVEVSTDVGCEGGDGGQWKKNAHGRIKVLGFQTWWDYVREFSGI